METLKFKTNIKCGGCIATVTPVLDGLKAIKNWEVDTNSADKILSVQTEGNIAANDIITALRGKGYEASRI